MYLKANFVQADAGVDPGNFARNLMREARKAAEASSQNTEGPLDSFQILCTALANSRHIIGVHTPLALILLGCRDPFCSCDLLAHWGWPQSVSLCTTGAFSRQPLVTKHDACRLQHSMHTLLERRHPAGVQHWRQRVRVAARRQAAGRHPPPAAPIQLPVPDRHQREPCDCRTGAPGSARSAQAWVCCTWPLASWLHH